MNLRVDRSAQAKSVEADVLGSDLRIATSEAVRQALTRIGAVGGLAPCIGPLLEALEWNGDPRHVVEAAPYLEPELGVEDLKTMMAALGFHMRLEAPRGASRRVVSALAVPALLIPASGPPLVILDADEEGATVFNAASGRTARIPAHLPRGEIWTFERLEAEADEGRPAESGSWMARAAAHAAPIYVRAMAMTGVGFVFALAPALFIMTLYDRIIPAHGRDMLPALVAGALGAVAGDALLRALRGRLMADQGQRLFHGIGTELFARLVQAPPDIGARMSVAARLQKLRLASMLKDALTGPGVNALLEAPFAAALVVALSFLAGSMAIPVICAALLYGGLIAAFSGAGAARAAEAARQAFARQEFIHEMVDNLNAIRLSGGGDVWIERFRRLSNDAALAGFAARRANATAAAAGKAVMAMAGIGAITAGAVHVMDGAMTAGVLIAAMTLVWRALSSMQALYQFALNARQIASSWRSVDQAMLTPFESAGAEMMNALPPVRLGRIELNRVSFRHSPRAEPALLGVSLDIAPGEIVAVTGPNGAGKSTLLRVILGLDQPQAGGVFIDGLDIRQLPPIGLRQSIGYAPQSFELFHGTLLQNLRLSMPTAGMDEIIRAARAAGLDKLVSQLPGGFEHRVGDHRTQRLSAGFVNAFALAAAYLRKPRILLLDEVVDGLDDHCSARFLEHLERLRGRVTVVMVTHRPSTMRRADRIVMLDGGAVARVLKPSEL